MATPRARASALRTNTPSSLFGSVLEASEYKRTPSGYRALALWLITLIQNELGGSITADADYIAHKYLPWQQASRRALVVGAHALPR